MFKKLIIIAAVATSLLSLMLATPRFVFAQNRHGCEWIDATDTCVVRYPTTCDTGCVPDSCEGRGPPASNCTLVNALCNCSNQGSVVNPLVTTSGSATSVVQKVIVNLVNLAYIAGVVIFFFMLVTGGIQWISSGGDKVSVANARSRISHAVIGLIVLMGVFALVYFMEVIFDVDLLRIDVGLISL